MYYGNTVINVLLHRQQGCRGKKLEADGSFRLLNCIYKEWMVERQNTSADTYGPVTQEMKYTPNASFLSKEARIAYTLPFQEIKLMFLVID